MKFNIPKSKWIGKTEEEKEKMVEEVFVYYRTVGFPYFNLTKDEQLEIFSKLVEFDTNKLERYIDPRESYITQVMLGLNLVNFYMPHMWEVKSGNFKTPMETFLNDGLFKKAIRKRMKLGDNLSDAGIRKALCWSNGAQRVSNFRPTVAKFIYDRYSGDGNVLDFSAGFGGRLIGALSSSKVQFYTGVDPSTKTFDRLCKLALYARDWQVNPKNTDIRRSPFEDCSISSGIYDLAFSSPPYFNTEVYSDEPTQSCNRYKHQNSWRDNFLVPTIQKCYDALKSGGYFIINVADVKTYPELEKDVCDLSKANGFTYLKTYHMLLSALMRSGYKTEPIFVFQKP